MLLQRLAAQSRDTAPLVSAPARLVLKSPGQTRQQRGARNLSRNGQRAVLSARDGGERRPTLPPLSQCCSTAWPPPIPATGIPYHKRCPPKNHKPLLTPVSHPKAPPGQPSTNTHQHSPLVAFWLSAAPSAPACEQSTSQTKSGNGSTLPRANVCRQAHAGWIWQPSLSWQEQGFCYCNSNGRILHLPEEEPSSLAL